MKPYVTIFYSFLLLYTLLPFINSFISTIKSEKEINIKKSIKLIKIKKNIKKEIPLLLFIYLFLFYSSDYFIWTTSGAIVNLSFNTLWFALLYALYHIDKQTYLLPDAFTYTLLLAGISLQIVNNTLNPTLLIIIFVLYLIGYIIHKVSFLLIKKVTIGYGDIKLLAAISPWIGWNHILLVFFIANALFILAFFIKKRQSVYAFGPYMIISSLLLITFNQN